MAQWVIRRKSDGLFWNDVSFGWVEDIAGAHQWAQWERDAIVADPKQMLVPPGEEWVELDDAGQPVEAKPVRMWVVRNCGRYYGGGNSWTAHDLAGASRFPCPQSLMFLPGENVPVLVHPDSTVTLDEPAPAIAQPSPYSDDEPIPYRLTDTDDRDNLIARIAVQYERAARHVRKAARLEKRLAKVAP